MHTASTFCNCFMQYLSFLGIQIATCETDLSALHRRCLMYAKTFTPRSPTSLIHSTTTKLSQIFLYFWASPTPARAPEQPKTRCRASIAADPENFRQQLHMGLRLVIAKKFTCWHKVAKTKKKIAVQKYTPN